MIRKHGRCYEWRKRGEHWVLLEAKRVRASLVPDEIYKGMWRVKIENEPLSDMVNLTRAKDAAIHEVSRQLDLRPTGRHAA